MSFEASKRRINESESLPGNQSIPPDRPVLSESELTHSLALENILDSDALGRLRTLFELLDTWEQKEKDDEK
jgi:hypothetical protein